MRRARVAADQGLNDRDPAAEITEIVRFAEGDVSSQMLRDVEKVLSIRAGRGDNPDVCFAAGDYADHFKTTDTPEIEIDDHDAQRLVVLIESAQCLIAIGSIVGGHTGADENPAEGHAKLGIVIYDEDLRGRPSRMLRW